MSMSSLYRHVHILRNMATHTSAHLHIHTHIQTTKRSDEKIVETNFVSELAAHETVLQSQASG